MKKYKIILIVAFLLLYGCNDSKKKIETNDDTTANTSIKMDSIETMDSGTIEVYCDSSYIFAMDSVFAMYRQRYDKVNLIIHYTNARNTTAQLLSGQTRVAIVGRDYLQDEDSLMQLYNVSKFYQMDIANDGLVFFTQRDFPTDTLNTEILYNVFTQNKKISSLLPLGVEPQFVIAEQNSSEYGNFIYLVCKQKKVTKNILLLPNTDSVLDYVKRNPNAIGICYLSQVQGKFYKILRIGYNDKDGKYIPATKESHQSYIIMNEYPYTTLLRLYLLEDRKNLPF
jgi:ABC-type phosphate transport system substrate-binding protein